MPAKQRVVELVQELNWLRTGNKYPDQRKIRCVYTLLDEHAESFDDHVLIVTKTDLDISASSKRGQSLKKATEMSDSLERIQTIFPYIPHSWDERKTLIRKAVSFANTKDEVIATLEKFEIL